MYSIKDDEKKQMLAEIEYYFKDEFDLNLGIIGTENILDFFKEMLGDRIYNSALDDAKKFYEKYSDDMVTDFYALYKSIR